MRLVRRILSFALVATSFVVSPTRAFADTQVCVGFNCTGGGDVGTTTNGFKYVYSNNAIYKIPVHGADPPGGFTDGAPGVQYEYFYQTDCPGSPPVTAGGDVGDLNCNQTGTSCANAGGILLLVWYRVVGTNGPPIESRTPICSQGNNKVTVPDLLIILDPRVDNYLKTQELDKPTVFAQPSKNALVNLPTIFSTPDTGTLEMPFLDPMPGTLEIVPSYAWDFGDGSSNTASAPGVPYDGTDPQKNPDHYPVLHTFQQPAGYQVTATVTWTATTLHIDGVGDIAVTDKTRVFTGVLPVAAHEAHAVLVSGG